MRVFLAILVAALSANCWAGTYVYASRVAAADESSVERMEIDVAQKKLFRGHVADVFLECEAQYFCLRTIPLHFAVPRAGGLRDGQRWQSMGMPFEVTGIEDFAVLGQHESVFVIASRRSNTQVDFFYYSERRGLLAIRTTVAGPDPLIDFLIIEGKNGFPR
jgi:hypothetical protein